MAYARKQYGTTKIKGKARVDGPVEIVVDSVTPFTVENSSGTDLLTIETTGDIKGVGGFKQPVFFMQDNVTASQSAVALVVAGQPSCTEIALPWAGSIIGISVRANAARSAGHLTVDATIGGTATGLQATLNAANTQTHSATQAKDTDAFSANGLVGVKITSGSTWAPTTADVVVGVWVEA